MPNENTLKSRGIREKVNNEGDSVGVVKSSQGSRRVIRNDNSINNNKSPKTSKFKFKQSNKADSRSNISGMLSPKSLKAIAFRNPVKAHQLTPNQRTRPPIDGDLANESQPQQSKTARKFMYSSRNKEQRNDPHFVFLGEKKKENNFRKKSKKLSHKNSFNNKKVTNPKIPLQKSKSGHEKVSLKFKINKNSSDRKLGSARSKDDYLKKLGTNTVSKIFKEKLSAEPKNLEINSGELKK